MNSTFLGNKLITDLSNIDSACQRHSSACWRIYQYEAGNHHATARNIDNDLAHNAEAAASPNMPGYMRRADAK